MPAITRALISGVRFDGRPPPELGGRAALAMRGLPWQPPRTCARGAPCVGRGDPGERAREISQLLTGRAVVLIATGRPVGRHAWELPAWRGRVGIRAAADLQVRRVRFADAFSGS